MSEYWKSTVSSPAIVVVELFGLTSSSKPKYWCKHCSTYVRDTAFEKRQHEATSKHQNNLKRFLRDIQNNHEREEREKERAKAEVERLNKVVGSAPTTSAATTASTSAKPAATARKAPAARLTSEDQKRQWSQLAQLGIEVPDDYRAEMAMAGAWKAVPQTRNQEIDSAADTLSIGVRKRKLDEQEQEDLEAGNATNTRRVWGRTTRTYPGDETQNLDDLLSGNITLKKDKQEQDMKQEAEPAEAREARATATPDGSPDAKPASRGNAVHAKPDSSDDSIMRVKSESAGGDAGDPSLNHIAEETPIPVFKKRKAKAAPAK